MDRWDAPKIIAELRQNRHELDAQWAAVLSKAGRTDFWWPDLVLDVWRLLQEERSLRERP